MEYRVYYETMMEAGRLMDAKDFHGALAVYNSLIDSDISDLDKSTICHNMALNCGELRLIDEAVAWYDEGIAYEEPYFRAMIAEYKARFLLNNGREAEALAIYGHLYTLPYQSEADKHRIEGVMIALRQRLQTMG